MDRVSSWGGGELTIVKQVEGGVTPDPLEIFEVTDGSGNRRNPVAKVAVACATARRAAQADRRRAAEALLFRLLAESYPDWHVEWRLSRSARGAPRLSAVPDELLAIRVSLSHCPGWVAAAFTSEPAIGIDIEVAREGRDTAALAAYLGWDACAASPMAFHRRWVLWESYIKCRDGRLLERAGPEFETLCESGGESLAGLWHGFALPLAGAAYAAIVLRTAKPGLPTLCRMTPSRDRAPL